MIHYSVYFFFLAIFPEFPLETEREMGYNSPVYAQNRRTVPIRS